MFCEMDFLKVLLKIILGSAVTFSKMLSGQDLVVAVFYWKQAVCIHPHM